ncbi:MAG TPA: hypothetical protein H9749_04560 [Candidatus Acutalibacter stercorigallinarum]|nr:hypothetical protein [Candidatus Acutalibacter stercorigallinarum]
MKRQWIAPILGVGIGAVLWGIWWVLAVTGLVPVLFVDGTFFTGIVLLVLALMTLTKPSPTRDTTVGAYQSRNFGVHAVFGLKLKVEKGKEQRERRGPTSKEVGTVFLLSGLMCFGPFVVSLFL